MSEGGDWTSARLSGRAERTPAKPARRRARRKVWPFVCLLAAAIVIAYAVIAAGRTPHFDPAQASRSITVRGAALHPDWPDYGQAALALGNGPVLATKGKQHPAATASTAKLIVCLVVLQKRPLSGDAQGPSITFTQSDVDNYNRYVGVDGSVVPVRVGERMTEREALEAILLPSANNIADTLAIWAYGSLADYRAAATRWLSDHGLRDTRMGTDASGFAPDTVSTAVDLVRIGQLAMQNDVVRSVVAMQTAQLPDVGTVHNVDTILGSDGVVGIKTGNSDQNGGVFVGAATKRVAGRTVTVVTAISGAPTLDDVLADSRDLLVSATKALVGHTVVDKGEPVGTFDTPDGTVTAVAARSVQLVTFGDRTLTATVHLDPIGPGGAGRTVGRISASGITDVPVITRDAVSDPSLFWKLLHP